MMTLQEAYLKAKKEQEKRGRTRLTDDCRDFGAFWGFDFINPTAQARDGFAYITVNKKTGDIRYFNPAMDFDLWDKSTPIPIEQFAEYNVAI